MPDRLNREHSRLPFLDALRGLMALWVLAGHVMLAVGLTLPILSQVQAAVDIFMFVSGFLMAFYFRLRQTSEPWGAPGTWRNFYIRRFFRIAPAYYLALTIALLFRAHFQHWTYLDSTVFPPPWANVVREASIAPPLSWQDVVAHFTFLFGFFPHYAASNALPDWSIGLEMQFYLALPFIMLLIRRAGHAVAAILLLAAWAAAHHLFGVYLGSAPGPLGLFPQPTLLPLRLNCFLTGILLAEGYYFVSQSRLKALLLLLAAAGVAYATSSKYLVLAALISALLLARPQGATKGPWLLAAWGNRICDSRVCMFMADTSYGVYLLHHLVLLPLAARFAADPRFVHLPARERYLLLLGCVLLMTYPAASLLNHFIERPGIACGRRFIRRTRAHPPADGAPAEDSPAPGGLPGSA